jgi:RNA polymerase sporulation-specific sigma factor
MAVSDEELINQIRKNDPQALNEIIERYKSLIEIRVSNYFINGAEKDDLMQEGRIGLFKAIMNYDPIKDASFNTFANLCIERQLINAVKNSNRQKHIPLNNYVSLNGSDDDSSNETIDTVLNNSVEDPLDTITKKEYMNEINDTLDKNLSDFEKNVLDLLLKGYKYEEIAKKLDSNSKAIDNAIQRIRKKTIKNLDNLD